MIFFKDPLFQAQFVRALGHTPSGGADIGECLQITSAIRDGDRESWYATWEKKADELQQMADQSAAAGVAANARNQYLRASNYYRSAAIMIEDDPEDPRILSAWKLQAGAFRSATRYFSHPVERVGIVFEGEELPGYLYLCSKEKGSCPLLLLLGGGDGTLEESYFTAAEAVNRGYHCLTFDGPGQGELLRERRIPFRPEWEMIVSAAVDFASSRSEIDADQIVLMGRSLGGYFAARGASGDQRIAACITDPGIYDSYETFLNGIPPEGRQIVENGDPEKIDSYFDTLLAQNSAVRFKFNLRMWRYGVQSVRELLEVSKQYTLKGIIEKITCPMLVLDNELEYLSKGQARRLYDALGCPKTYRLFTVDEGAGGHCEPLAAHRFSEVVYGWLEGIKNRRLR